MADEDAASTGRYPSGFGDWMNTGNSNSLSGKHKACSVVVTVANIDHFSIYPYSTRTVTDPTLYSNGVLKCGCGVYTLRYDHGLCVRMPVHQVVLLSV